MNTKLALIAILGFFIGYTIGDLFKSNLSYQQDIGQSKSVKMSKTRYFFVGYHINTGRQTISGNAQWFANDGLMPAKEELFKFLKKEMPSVSFTDKQFVIVGLHEFKTKTDCEQFFKDQKEK